VPRAPLAGPPRGVLPLSAALHAASARTRPVRPDTAFGRHLDAAPVLARTTLPRCPVRPSAGVPVRYSPMQGLRPAPIRPDQVGAITTAAVAGYLSDVSGTAARVEHTVLYLAVNRVADLAPGIYRHNAAAATLDLVRVGEPEPLLTRLMAYEAAIEASVICVPVGDYERGFPLYADRWYRMQNVEGGLVAERICLAAAALGLGSHIRCDFDAAGVAAAFGLHPRTQTPLAMILVGLPREPAPLHLPLNLSPPLDRAKPATEVPR
jgi:SagB-type dehydrogenase family enzyme